MGGTLEGLEYVDCKFRLAILAAKRAKQLVTGAKKRIDMKAENPLTIAIQEISDGKIKFYIPKPGEIRPKPEDDLFSDSTEESTPEAGTEEPDLFE
ncbi:MAG: DNA-directed RNA polymerase subunit omega [bacterium]|nr:DNA-directed RNA polymerase subunit omega [bacterium]